MVCPKNRLAAEHHFPHKWAKRNLLFFERVPNVPGKTFAVFPAFYSFLSNGQFCPLFLHKRLILRSLRRTDKCFVDRALLLRIQIRSLQMNAGCGDPLFTEPAFDAQKRLDGRIQLLIGRSKQRRIDCGSSVLQMRAARCKERFLRPVIKSAPPAPWVWISTKPGHRY